MWRVFATPPEAGKEPYESLIDFTPSLNHMLIITGTDKKQSKIS